MTRYDDIIRLPHYEPQYHPRMSMASRAAQFAPFAALTGHDAAIAETARLTDTELSLSDSELDELNGKLQMLAARLADGTVAVEVTYFLPDAKKSGGSYRRHSGTLRRIDPDDGVLIFADATRIPLRAIAALSLPE